MLKLLARSLPRLHTREAEQDTERILRQEVSTNYKVRAGHSLSCRRAGTDVTPRLVDPCSLLHQLAGFYWTAARPFSQPLYQYHGRHFLLDESQHPCVSVLVG